MPQQIELLAPAKNIECGIQAVNHGADAVYIGAPKFSARHNAGNSIADIEQLVRYAHRFKVKVYVALNTIFFDDEMSEVETLVWQLYHAGVDALIVQDMGLLSLHLPPITLHASTQADNRTVDKIRFLKQIGFKRVVLARELSLEQITDINRKTDIELEAFVHGALCVCYSGQCYMSAAMCGRSANRGKCAQYCRLPYSLQNAKGDTLIKNKHLLSLKDLNHSNSIKDMLNAGISSLKIEGRMKDLDYVKNITAFYRQKIDDVLDKSAGIYIKSSIGKSTFFFKPDIEKSFHRGSTEYFLHGRSRSLVQMDTPKSRGKYVGKVTEKITANAFRYSGLSLNNGDGLCFTGSNGEFRGFRVNRVENDIVFCAENINIEAGTALYRNYDHVFYKQLQNNSAERRIDLSATLEETATGFTLTLTDESGCSASTTWESDKQEAQKIELAIKNIKEQISKLGNTIYSLKELILPQKTFFIPASIIAQKRRETIELLQQKENLPHHIETKLEPENKTVFPSKKINYTGNVSNVKAKNFYLHHGVENIDPAFEIKAPKDAVLMHCKYCIRYELGLCHKQGIAESPQPLFLILKEKKFKLTFDCKQCEMRIEKDGLS